MQRSPWIESNEIRLVCRTAGFGQTPQEPPKLDRQGLIAALSGGKEVPGAILGNAPMTISVRTK